MHPDIERVADRDQLLPGRHVEHRAIVANAQSDIGAAAALCGDAGDQIEFGHGRPEPENRMGCVRVSQRARVRESHPSRRSTTLNAARR